MQDPKQVAEARLAAERLAEQQALARRSVEVQAADEAEASLLSHIEKLKQSKSFSTAKTMMERNSSDRVILFHLAAAFNEAEKGAR